MGKPQEPHQLLVDSPLVHSPIKFRKLSVSPDYWLLLIPSSITKLSLKHLTLQNSIGFFGCLKEWLALKVLLMPSILIGSAGQSSPPKVITLRGGRDFDMAAAMNMRKTSPNFILMFFR